MNKNKKFKAKIKCHTWTYTKGKNSYKLHKKTKNEQEKTFEKKIFFQNFF